MEIWNVCGSCPLISIPYSASQKDSRPAVHSFGCSSTRGAVQTTGVLSPSGPTPAPLGPPAPSANSTGSKMRLVPLTMSPEAPPPHHQRAAGNSQVTTTASVVTWLESAPLGHVRSFMSPRCLQHQVERIVWIPIKSHSLLTTFKTYGKG